MQRTPVHVRNPDLTPVAILPGKRAHGAHRWVMTELFVSLSACKWRPLQWKTVNFMQGCRLSGRHSVLSLSVARGSAAR